MDIVSDIRTDRMNILMAINDSYTEPAIVLLQSLFARSQMHLYIYFLVSDLCSANRQRLEHLIKKSGGSSEFISLDKETFKEAPSREKVSIETYYRLLAFALLPNVDKILYLDADMIVTGSLKTLWETDLTGYYMAGVADMGEVSLNLFHRAAIGMKHRNSTYINGGVLLMNLQLIRERISAEQVFQLISEKKSVLTYQDQDVINILFEGQIFNLPQIYNYAPLYHNTKDFFKYIFGLKRKEKPVIIHYFGDMKPWNHGYGHKYLWQYWKYCRYGDCKSIRRLVVKNLLTRPISIIAQGYRGWIWEQVNKLIPTNRIDLYRFWISHVGTYAASLLKNGYNKIAIYGFGMWGKAVLKELSNTQVTVAYVIDRYAKKDGFSETRLLRPDEVCETVQLILICIENNFSEILYELQNKNIAPVMTLEDFVFQIYTVWSE